MGRFPRGTAAIVVACAAVQSTFATVRVIAQDAGVATADAAIPVDDAAVVADDALSPPVLIESVPAVYPEAARAAGIEGTVVLELTIDANGNVTGVSVIEPAGHGFDEAALDAALGFRFAPARRNGQAISARIRYPYTFTLAVPSPVAPAMDRSETSASTPDRAAPATREPTVAPAPRRRSTSARAVDVTVRGALTDAERLQQSAEAVSVVDLGTAREQTADMGEVLARTQGISIRRYGGVGSSTRFSLNGLQDEQVRFFLDGVPLELSGYPFGIANLPVNLLNRIEVYRGVVPIRFGADALGGALNFVSNERRETALGVSYQIGSFGIHRATVDGQYVHEPSGFVIGGAAFFDLAENDYRIDVETTDERGRLSPATVPRFHDGYRAYAGMLEAGFVDRPWARRLLVRGFASTYDKEQPHNIVMTVPYGEVTYGETVYGATARYEVALHSNVDLELVANYAHGITDFEDKAEWVYDWHGNRVRQRRIGGEIEADPRDQTVWENSVFGRAMLAWKLTNEHTLRLSVTPRFTTRTGDERLQANPDARDPLTAERDLLTFVGGAEYELNLLEGRLSNIFFVKDYVYVADSEEDLSGGIFRERDTTSHTLGIGNGFRFRFAPWIYAKASYEYATRLPRPDEVFGDAALIQANLELEPETSHNANLGPRVELRRTNIGDVTVDINAFLRDSDDLIVLLGNDRFFTYQNVFRARGLGLENAFMWTSPGRWVSAEGMLTWQDVRNQSTEGTFGDFEGDRIPNRPYLFGSWGMSLRFPNLPGPNDVVKPFYNGRYVHEFFRGWESQGLREFKQVVDAQVIHNVGVSWTYQHDLGRVTSTFQIENVTDAKAFDNFGVERPRRGFFFKLSGEI